MLDLADHRHWKHIDHPDPVQDARFLHLKDARLNGKTIVRQYERKAR